MGKILDYEPAIQAYISGQSLEKTARTHKVDRHTLAQKLSDQGVEIRSNHSYWTHTINHSAFDELTDESAYWAGMLMADGCIYHAPPRVPEIRLELSDKDKAHVERFRRFLSVELPVRERKIKMPDGRVALYNLCVGRSRQIADKLATYGVIPGKLQRTHVTHLEHNRHFWRGVMDGDGCLTWAAHYPSIQLVGNNGLMQQFCEHIAQALDIHLSPKKFKKNIWTVSIYCRKACAVAQYLYIPSDIALERKQTIAEKFADFYA